MRIRLGVSPDIDTDTMGAAIDAALEASAVSQVPLIERGKVPDIRDCIQAGQIRWKPEPPGDEHFDDAKTVIKRGWGDCDDLAPWLAATLRATGEAPDAFPFVYQSGPRRWHAVVDRGDGKVLDPSKWAGMGRREVVGVAPAVWSPMWADRLALAAHPFADGWAGRVDIPDVQLPISWSALSYGRSPRTAVSGAIRGACRIADIAGDIEDVHIARLCGIQALLDGHDYDVVGEYLGEHVGFLPALLPAAASLASPLIKKVLPGGSRASAPSPGAHPSGNFSRGNVPPGTTLLAPGGPIIVRF